MLRSITASFGAPLAFTFALASLVGCSSNGDDSASAPSADSVVSAMHDSLLGDIKDLKTAAIATQAAAPAPADRGWDATEDQAAFEATQAAWKQARTAYEHTEGALAPIFPNIDVLIDARYDDYLAALPQGDTDLFDDQSVTGLHGAERILFADVIPERVVTFESTLVGYEPASFPTTAEQANEFKTLLLNKIIADATTLETQWTPAEIDLNGAFNGLVSLTNEQREKVNNAATGEEPASPNSTRFIRRSKARRSRRHRTAGAPKIHPRLTSTPTSGNCTAACRRPSRWTLKSRSWCR
ncbi:MAG TPA: imelysin family protein [Polyangiaceae bacterium]